MRFAYTTHVRELQAMLWRAMVESPDDVIVLPDDLRATADVRRAEPTADELRECLSREGGSVRRAASALGLPRRT